MATDRELFEMARSRADQLKTQARSIRLIINQEPQPIGATVRALIVELLTEMIGDGD